jgi:hypothetical protein
LQEMRDDTGHQRGLAGAAPSRQTNHSHQFLRTTGRTGYVLTAGALYRPSALYRPMGNVMPASQR